MIAVTAGQMRELDRRTIEEAGISGIDLMERAGAGVANAVFELIHYAQYRQVKVLLVAGHGNNGGDAFVAARLLNERGLDVEVLVSSETDRIKGDALEALKQMQSAGVEPRPVVQPEEWERLADRYSCGRLIIVDGVLGTGISGPVRGAAAAAIRFINRLGEKNQVLAIDVPSGLDSDTGGAEGLAVIADRTVTMGLPKLGLLTQAGTEHVGALDVVDIGIPLEFYEGLPSDIEFIAAEEVSGLITRRGASTHKGSYGHVLVIGGAEGFAGAPAMASLAALMSGAGLVTALVPEALADAVVCVAPEVMVKPGRMTDTGSLAVEALDVFREGLKDFDAVLVGPGMTTHDQTLQIVGRILDKCNGPVVLDADALNVCSGDTGILKTTGCGLVLTPHPGEMARLAGCSTAEIQAQRVGEAVSLADSTGAVVVLKGAGTVVAAKGHVPAVNRTGNPGMASGGMGDVLGGLLAGLAAQGLGAYDAARAAVYIHGRAGDIAAMAGSQATLTVGDVLEVMSELPGIFHGITGR